jgi:hypothetical protein
VTREARRRDGTNGALQFLVNTVAAPTSWALFALPAPAEDAAASVVVRAGANASGASLFLATHGALPSAAAGSCNVSWRLPPAGAALRLDVGAALAPFWGDSAAARDASLPWTLGVLKALADPMRRTSSRRWSCCLCCCETCQLCVSVRKRVPDLLATRLASRLEVQHHLSLNIAVKPAAFPELAFSPSAQLSASL